MDDLAISKNSIHPEQTEIIMYQTEDGLTKIDVRMENETVWLTQAQMAELFQRERSGITKHIKNVFAEGEVDEKSNVSLLKNIILMTKNDISNEIYNKVLDLCKLIFENYNVKNNLGGRK